MVTAFHPSCQIPRDPEHRIELRAPSAGGVGGVEAVAHAHAVERALDVAFDGLGGLFAEYVQDGGDQVDGMVVLRADLAL